MLATDKRGGAPGPALAEIRHRHRIHWREGSRMLVLEALLILVAAIFLVPFLWLISTSLKPETELFSRTIDWIPSTIKWSNYSDALNEFPFLRYFTNTMIVCIPVVIGSTASSSFVAYGFSRVSWRGREALFLVVLGTLILPYQVTMIPLFLLFRNFGWINTFYPLIVPSFFGNAFFIFLFRQLFLVVPVHDHRCYDDVVPRPLEGIQHHVDDDRGYCEYHHFLD